MMPEKGFTDPDVTKQGVSSPRVGDPKGRWGAGTNHHLALHVPNRNGLLKWKRRLTDFGYHVTGPYNRHYFHAIYFRDPDGAIIEIATTEPGFGHDEEVLGSGFRPQPKENLIGGRDEASTARRRPGKATGRRRWKIRPLWSQRRYRRMRTKSIWSVIPLADRWP
jgi:hypothetical protein